LPREFRHITKIGKDLTNISKRSLKVIESRDSSVDLHCALSTTTDFNGLAKFYIGWKCGCLLSAQNLKEIQSQEEQKADQKLCIACSQEQGALISLNQSVQKQHAFMKKLDETNLNRLNHAEVSKKDSALGKRDRESGGEDGEEVKSTKRHKGESQVYKSLFS